MKSRVHYLQMDTSGMSRTILISLTADNSDCHDGDTFKKMS